MVAYDKSLEKVIEILETDLIDGLSEQKVTKNLEVYGTNEIPQVKGSFWQIYLAPLFDTLITVYLIMTGILLGFALYLIIEDNDFSNVTQAGQWLVIVLINFAIAIIQQSRAQKKMDALQKLSVGKTKVKRQGTTNEVEVTELFPGDVIELNQGDAIPADCRLVKSANMLVNEASLTGESVPAVKTEDGTLSIESDTPIGERINMVYKGTFVQTGNGQAVVVNTGVLTQIGQISTELAELNTGEIPLRRKVNVLGAYLALGMLIFLSILTVYTFFQLSDRNQLGNLSILSQFFINNIVIAMSIMPINIPLLTTIVLLTGVLAMATHRVVIRNLSAVESLGRISILCSDKTGTITRSQMTVKRIWDGHQLYGVTGLGYGPSGLIFPTDNKVSAELNEEIMTGLDDLQLASPGSALELMLLSGMLNNNAEILVEDVMETSGQTTWKATGSATDAALLALFNKSNLDKLKIHQNYIQEREFPFDSAVKRMSMIFSVKGENEYFVFCKGAIEVLLKRCNQIGYPGYEEEFTEQKREEVKKMVDGFAAFGFRILTLTYKKITSLPEKGPEERKDIENNLVFLGFVCVLDPPREGVKDAVAEARSAGITPIMITGDSPVTAGTIAREVGMLQEGQEVHEGKKCETLPDANFFNTVVWARVSPKHKQIIVERYQKQNKVVAMTGDGVNDALALSMADAGICMGITGTDVAKQASDIVITDDSYVSIVTGVRQGRSLFQKIRLMIMFYIGVNAGAEALIYFGTSFIPDFFLLGLWQRIYIFGLLHAIPPFALIFDRASRDIMQRDPIDTAGIFNRQLLFGMLSFSLVLAIMGYIIYFVTYWEIIPVSSINMDGFQPIFITDSASVLQSPENWAHAKARTMFLTVLYIAESTFVLSIRRIDKSLFRALKEDGFWFVYLFVFSMPALHLLIMYLPFIQDFAGNLSIVVDLIYLDPLDWIIAIIAGLLPVLSLEIYKKYIRNQGKYF